jgi:hypothetical protein
MLRVDRIAGGAGVAGSELRGDGLADDHTTGGTRPGDGRAVRPWLVGGPDRRAVLARLVGRVEHVLDADGDTVQGAGTGGLRRGTGECRIVVREDAKLWLAAGDPVETGLGQRLRAEATFLHKPDGLRSGQLARITMGHRHVLRCSTAALTV